MKKEAFYFILVVFPQKIQGYSLSGNELVLSNTDKVDKEKQHE